MDMDALKRALDWRSYPSSAYLLLASNAAAMILALLLGMDPAEVVWAYWLESVMIGLFTVLAFILMASRSLPSSPGSALAPLGNAVFFIVHYGIFHFVYLMFLAVMPTFAIDEPDLLGIGMIAAAFALSHAYSFFTNVLRNPSELDNTHENRNRVMMAPYGRIIPMHLAIILSGFLILPMAPIFIIADALGSEPAAQAALWLMRLLAMLLLIALKTIADLAGHLSRHQKS
ncbi:MAG: DUF6498-containing protein [Candidatus Micrarchaeota archaeon]